jgi:Sporulation and spore germination/Immunoglobulin-like domain of bacterial spore germination
MVRGLVLCFVLAVLAAGCGKDDQPGETGSATAAVATTVTDAGTTTTEEPTTTAPAEEFGRVYQAWFVSDGQLALTWAQGEPTVGVLTEAMLLLLQGPASGDTETAIPAGTELVNLGLKGGTATVDLSGEFAAADELAIAQVVFTATQFGTVGRVKLLVEGEPLAAAPTPKRRKNFADLLPPIVVETPSGLQPVESTFTVAGTSNVFEANVTILVLDEDGNELFRDFTTATCGTGCRGRYKSTITVDFGDAESGTLVVQDDDADGDGEPSYKVEIPLTFNRA